MLKVVVILTGCLAAGVVTTCLTAWLPAARSEIGADDFGWAVRPDAHCRYDIATGFGVETVRLTCYEGAARTPAHRDVLPYWAGIPEMEVGGRTSIRYVAAGWPYRAFRAATEPTWPPRGSSRLVWRGARELDRAADDLDRRIVPVRPLARGFLGNLAIYTAAFSILAALPIFVGTLVGPWKAIVIRATTIAIVLPPLVAFWCAAYADELGVDRHLWTSQRLSGSVVDLAEGWGSRDDRRSTTGLVGAGLPWRCFSARRFYDYLEDADVWEDAVFVRAGGGRRVIPLRPIPAGLAADFGVGFLAAFVVMAVPRLVRQARRRLRHACHRCGFDLAAAGSTRCPECGWSGHEHGRRHGHGPALECR